MVQNTRITLIVRIIQTVCGMGAMGCSVAITITEWEVPTTVNSAWAGALVSTIAILMLSFFLHRPVELWPLPCVLDCLGVAFGIAGVAALSQSEHEYAWGYAGPLYVLPLTAMSAVTVLFIGTAVHTWRLQRERVREREPSDPLQPYLMKKEIDVWCYPVQNENGQVDIQYKPAPTGAAQGQALAAKEPHAHSVELAPYPPPSIQGDYRIEHIEIVQHGQPSILSQPLTDTVAGWSVPSKSATLRLSQITPGTFTASLRSPEPTIKSSKSRDEESQ